MSCMTMTTMPCRIGQMPMMLDACNAVLGTLPTIIALILDDHKPRFRDASVYDA